jgi:uncharacterized repeat protein (TIGR01451 family)
MRIRHNGGQQRTARSTRAARAWWRGGERWRRWASLAALVLLAAFAPAAVLAPAGQAHGAGERSPEEEAARESAKQARQTERAERVAAIRAEREAERAAARANGQATRNATPGGGSKAEQNSSRERVHGDVQFSCTHVTWTYTAFPEGKNTVYQLLTIKGGEPSKIATTFTFEGTSGEDTMAVPMPKGSYKVDGYAKWNSNGLKGGMDVLGTLTCAAAPSFTIEKLQKVAGATGSEGEYGTATVKPEVGDTLDYEIIVKNTGNVPLSLAEFTDTHCEGISGGPGSEALAVGGSTTYRCMHVVEAPGPYTNSAEVTGTPPAGDGRPSTRTSNTVLAETQPGPPQPAPGMSIEKLQRIGASGPYTTSTLKGNVGETVSYEIIVTNTGNVPLKLAAFSDPRCDEGTLSGGTEGATLAVGASTDYTCTHVLDAADATGGSYSNTVSLTATPPSGGSLPITTSSNTVVVEVPSTPSSGGNAPSSGAAGSSGVLSSSFAQPSKSGVLAFASETVPTLKGPQGCVRQSFRLSIKSVGVASVTFYMDGHKLKTLTAKNARKGLLTISINPATLKLGVHKLSAKITMAHAPSAKAKQATRTVKILRCQSQALTPKFTG